jgi:hypothetical protein
MAVVSVAMVLIVAVIGVAQAHYVYNKPTLYASRNDCPGGWSGISHGIGGGSSKSGMDAWPDPANYVTRVE